MNRTRSKTLARGLALAALAGCTTNEPLRASSEPARSTTPTATVTHQASSAATHQAPSAAAQETSAAPPWMGSGVPTAPHRVVLEDKAMGTHVLLAAYTSAELDEAAIKPKLRMALDEIRRLEALMTTWRDDSEISQINAAAGAKPVKVGPETMAVIEKSLWISKSSEGVFDITFDAMRGLWKFDEGREERIPEKSGVEKARKLIDYRKIKVDPKASTVLLEKAGMRMSLGGIAKGYAVDAAARVLRKEGLTSFFAQAGGDLFVQGQKPDGTRYKVGVRDPRGKDANDFFARLDVQDHAFSTAGDYERSFVRDGKRYHHIIDPRTGWPATASRSVTIWAKDAFTADSIDDAVFILGPEKGLALVESIDDCGAVIVDDKNKVWISKRLEGLVQVLRDPTDGI
jgi:thiamine biosynthesis lipoprotein